MDPAQPTYTSGILASQAAAGAATTGESALPNVPSRLGYLSLGHLRLLLARHNKNYMDRNVLACSG